MFVRCPQWTRKHCVCPGMCCVLLSHCALFKPLICPHLSHLQHKAYFPDEEDREQLARDQEEDHRTEGEAVCEPPLAVPDSSHLMDTVARFAGHPYHLRSLHRGGAGQQQVWVGQLQEGVGQEEREEQGVLFAMGDQSQWEMSVQIAACCDNYFLLIITSSIL